MEELNTILIGKKPIIQYVTEAIVRFSEGADVVVLYARGDNIHKAVEVYNELVRRLQDSLKLEGIEIGSEMRGNRRVSYIKIKVRRVLF